jgi:hypothetical protein
MESGGPVSAADTGRADRRNWNETATRPGIVAAHPSGCGGEEGAGRLWRYVQMSVLGERGATASIVPQGPGDSGWVVWLFVAVHRKREPLIAPEPGIEDELTSVITENWEFFARWDNGEMPPDQIDWLGSRTWDDGVLVNDRMPDAISTKSSLREFFPAMHGRFADDPVSARIEFLVVGELATNVHVVTYRQHYDFSSGKTTSRVITEILVRKDDELRVQYIHE